MSAATRPVALLDPLAYVDPTSYFSTAYQGDLAGGANLVYIGFARPGASTTAAVWRIFKIAYSGNVPISITWPHNSSGNASNDFAFIWANRASLTYS